MISIFVQSWPSISPRYDASSATLLANPANLTQFLLGWSKGSRMNSRHSLLHSSTHRWAAALFRHLKRLLPSRQSLRRRLWIRTTSGTIGPFQTSRSYPSSSSARHTNKLLATLIGFHSLQSCSPPTGSTDQLKQLQLRSCWTSTRRRTRVLSTSSAFSTLVPRSTQSTINPSARLRGQWIGHPVDWVLPHGTQPIRAVQRGHFKDCTSPLRCAAGIRPGVDPGVDTLHLLLGRSHRHRSSSRLQGARVRRRPIQIYGSSTQGDAADLMARMLNCVECVASWMSSNPLRLNPSKSELIWLGTGRRLQHCTDLNMRVCGADVRSVEYVRDLGVLIDSNMTLSNHVNNVAGICFYQLRQLRIIRRSLTTEAAHSLVRALIHTRVDYCNGLLAAGPRYLHEKLQSVLGAAARLVLQLPHRSSVSDIMRQQLHWLEMPDRITFKLCTLVYRCLHGFAPRYLSDLCTPATVHTHLRSSVTLERSLSNPRMKTKTIGRRGFYLASSAAWNALPVHLRDPDLSLNSFKIKLKTHLFPDVPHLGSIYPAIFVRRARQRDLVGACKYLNWIELNLFENR